MEFVTTVGIERVRELEKNKGQDIKLEDLQHIFKVKGAKVFEKMYLNGQYGQYGLNESEV